MKEGVKEGGAYYVLILSTKCSFVLRKPLIEKIHYPRKRTDINAALTSFDVETLVGNQITRPAVGVNGWSGNFLFSH